MSENHASFPYLLRQLTWEHILAIGHVVRVNADPEERDRHLPVNTITGPSPLRTASFLAIYIKPSNIMALDMFWAKSRPH